MALGLPTDRLAGKLSITDIMTRNKNRKVRAARRARVALNLLAGVRGRDLRSGVRFMNLRFAGSPLPMRAAKFARWTADIAIRRVPDSASWFTFGEVSSTPYWLRDGNPWDGHPWLRGGTLPSSADVVVVGAGFGGASVAYHWSRQANGRLLLLDRMAPAAGAAGRNAGFLTAAGGSYHGYYVFEPVRAYAASVLPNLGSEALDAIAAGFADAYVRALSASVAAIHETIARERIECDVRRNGNVVLTDEWDAPRLGAALSLGDQLGWEGWQRIDAAEVEHRTGIVQPWFAALQSGTSTWNPARWVWGLLDAALRRGNVELFTRTNVLRVLADGDGYIVVTDRGDIRARHVVNATEANTKAVFGEFLRDDPDMIRTHKSQAMYASGDPGVMRGGAITSPLGWFHPRDTGFLFGSDNVRVPIGEALENRPSRFISSFMCAEATRLWPCRPFRVTHEWTGTVGQAPDKFPVIGSLDGANLRMLGGFAGAGSAISFGSGAEIVQQILGESNAQSLWPDDLFGPGRFAKAARYGERFRPPVAAEAGAR